MAASRHLSQNHEPAQKNSSKRTRNPRMNKWSTSHTSCEEALCNERQRKNNNPTKSGLHNTDSTRQASPTMNPQPDHSKDTIRFPLQAAVHTPATSTITQIDQRFCPSK
ncbi:uncharacterized protein V6R79_017743 [Siganus canaliculatus]